MARPRFDIVPNGYDPGDVGATLSTHEASGFSAAGWERFRNGFGLRTRDVGYDIAQVNEYLFSLVRPPVWAIGPAAERLWPPAVATLRDRKRLSRLSLDPESTTHESDRGLA
ncbi:hypothetical protein Lfu02_48100 [Longispora fulva]|uniref:Uncharacterized protein n=1 Tax=Longispora fulva TaxID=619741 RepID=A0A8J7KLN5_9ACTN|nr:hypothetical protein [Longispora fulva]MBG6138186.1 hypothetical protein [Longispora fulva]GIG60438.1 hypothetical protein Lfu02_48100 [Longispora fulva]